jgi:hypothetical protein
MVLQPAQALAEAERLLAAGEPFAAHDVLEGIWKSQRAVKADDTARWHGLAQIAVGLTHLQRGNAVGAARLLERGAGNAGPGEFSAWALRLAAAIAGTDEKAVSRLLDSRPKIDSGVDDR